MKDILIIAGLGILAVYLFKDKSPSPLFTNPKIAIPDKVAEVETPTRQAPISNIPRETKKVNSVGEYETIENIFC
jgi:hypothetical protein